MEFKRLTVKEQIEFVRAAKFYYEKYFHNGMCSAFQRAYNNRFSTGNIFVHGDTTIRRMLSVCLPMFNYTNLYKKGIEGVIPKLKYYKGTALHEFWWDKTNCEARVQVFDWLISELEKKL